MVDCSHEEDWKGVCVKNPGWGCNRVLVKNTNQLLLDKAEFAKCSLEA